MNALGQPQTSVTTVMMAFGSLKTGATAISTDTLF
jgi:hypothetical protein